MLVPYPEPKKTLHISTLQIPSSGDKNQGIMLYLAFANVFTSALELCKTDVLLDLFARKAMLWRHIW